MNVQYCHQKLFRFIFDLLIHFFIAVISQIILWTQESWLPRFLMCNSSPGKWKSFLFNYLLIHRPNRNLRTTIEGATPCKLGIDWVCSRLRNSGWVAFPKWLRVSARRVRSVGWHGNAQDMDVSSSCAKCHDVMRWSSVVAIEVWGNILLP